MLCLLLPLVLGGANARAAPAVAAPTLLYYEAFD